MRPYHGGGDMIKEVTFAKTTYQDAPLKFEAGTPPIAEVLGLGAALTYLTSLDRKALHLHESNLLKTAMRKLSEVDGLKILGTAKNKSSVITFTLSDMHPLDLGVLIGLKGIAIRTGVMCANPTLHHFGIQTAARISFGLYNNLSEIDHFLLALAEVRSLITR